MKYIAAYALLVLGGNEKPSDADVRKVLQEVGGEVNEEELTRVVNALKGKQLHEVIAAGSKKLSTVSFGGSSAAPAGGSTTAAPAKTEAKKEEKPAAKEEEADVGLGGGLFGDDEEW